MSALDQSFGFLVHDIGHLDVVLCRFVESGGNHFGIDTTRHVGHFLRTLVDEQDDHIYLGVVLEDGVGQFLEQHRLTRLGLGYNQSALTLANRREQIDHTYAERIAVTGTKLELMVGEERNQVLKRHAMFGHLGCEAIDADHLVHREEFIRLRVDADGALDGVAGFEAVLTHLVFAHIDIVWRG